MTRSEWEKFVLEKTYADIDKQKKLLAQPVLCGTIKIRASQMLLYDYTVIYELENIELRNIEERLKSLDEYHFASFSNTAITECTKLLVRKDLLRSALDKDVREDRDGWIEEIHKKDRPWSTIPKDVRELLVGCGNLDSRWDQHPHAPASIILLLLERCSPTQQSKAYDKYVDAGIVYTGELQDAIETFGVANNV